VVQENTLGKSDTLKPVKFLAVVIYLMSLENKELDGANVVKNLRD